MLMQNRPAIFFDQYHEAILGQWIRTWNGYVWHHGIVSGFWQNPATLKWDIMVTHNVLHWGVVVTKLDSFCDNRPFEIVRSPQTVEHQRMILLTAQENVGKTYDLFNRNCEHFATFCYTHRAESKQLQNVVSTLAFVGVAFTLIAASSR